MKQKAYINLSKSLPEIFDEVRQLEDNEQRSNLLRRYKTKTMTFYIYNLYNQDWSDIKIPYEYKAMTAPPGLCYSNIGNSINRLVSAKEMAKSNPKRSTDIVQQVLESVSSDEAILLIRLFNNQKIQGISKAVLRSAFPELFVTHTDDKE